jgi:hypothetical protein
MSRFLSSITVLSLLVAGWGARAGAQAAVCIGAACQQTCSGSGTTSITGTVYAPNGTDPIPNVTVYIPTVTPDPLPLGLTCPMVGAAPSGAPLMGTETDVKGNFELDNVPVGSVPLVILAGKWRRQFTVQTTACITNALPSTPYNSATNPVMPFVSMPQNQLQGDIPKIAIATGAVDQVECVLRKVGISDSEFTDPTGSGRINLYLGSSTPTKSSGPGSGIDLSTPTQASLMENSSLLSAYDVLMLPCQGAAAGNVEAGAMGATELANFINFANDGGRVYASHLSYAWLFQNSPFDSVVNWDVGQASLPSGTATVDTSFTGGQTLSTWLQEVGATSPATPGQMALDTLRVDTKGVNAPTRSWLTLNNSSYNNPVMQFVFDTPVAPAGQTVNQCGRVLFNEYHVEGNTSSPAQPFPTECVPGAMTAQEKLLEYMLFELTDDGGQPTLAPLVQDFGSEAIGYSSTPVTFTWTNNSSFASQVNSVAITAGATDFAVANNGCANVTVQGGGSCQITVVFTPSALAARAGTLSVVAQGNTQTAQLTGTGTPGFILSGTALSYGSLDVGGSSTQTLALTNIAGGALAVPQFVTTGQYSVSTAACANPLPAHASCAVQVSFMPTMVGPLVGTVGVNSINLLYAGLNGTMTGTGVDFTISLSPPAGTVIAGDGTMTTATLTPLAGFAAPLTVTCVVQGATAATGCTLSTALVTPAASATAVTINLTTTSQYVIVGYGGFGGRGYLWLVGLATGCLLWRRRRGMSAGLRGGVMMVLLAAVGLSLTGCSGKVPAQNGVYSGQGNYTVTVTATDVPAGGVLTHVATYSLTVTAK